MEILTLQDIVLKTKLKNYVYDIIGCCQEVHKEKGPELTEYVYQDCLEIALSQVGVPFKREYFFTPTYKGIKLKSSLRVDFFCKENVFVECKAIEKISFDERVQLANYMRNARIRIGILYNFAPLYAECEKFYLDTSTNQLYFF